MRIVVRYDVPFTLPHENVAGSVSAAWSSWLGGVVRCLPARISSQRALLRMTAFGPAAARPAVPRTMAVVFMVLLRRTSRTVAVFVRSCRSAPRTRVDRAKAPVRVRSKSAVGNSNGGCRGKRPSSRDIRRYFTMNVQCSAGKPILSRFECIFTLSWLPDDKRTDLRLNSLPRLRYGQHTSVNSIPKVNLRIIN